MSTKSNSILIVIFKIVWVALLALVTLAWLSDRPEDAGWKEYLTRWIPFAVLWIVTFVLLTGFGRKLQVMEIVPQRYGEVFLKGFSVMFFVIFAILLIQGFGIFGIIVALIPFLVLKDMFMSWLKKKNKPKLTPPKKTSR